MTHFNEALKDENVIVRYEDETNPDNNWRKCHVSRSLKHLKEDDNFELLLVENVDNGRVLLITDNTGLSELKNKYSNLDFMRKIDLRVLFCVK